MAEENISGKGDELKLVQGRSPAYPYIPLDRAIERVEQVVKAGGTRQALTPETFYKIWDLGAASSGARQTMAALNHFGLVDYLGRGAERKVKLSDNALRIALDKRPGSDERTAAIQAAALSPAIHRELCDKYGALMPANVIVETYLVRDRGYNPSAAEALINEYKATFSYAGLDKPMHLLDDEDGPTAATPIRSRVAVGDLIQWESAGFLRMPEPTRVTGIAETGDFVFVEGSLTGIPMSEVSVVQAASKADDSAASTLPMAAPLKPPQAGMRQDTWHLDEGVVVLQYPTKMSASSFEDFEGWIQLQLRKIKRSIEQ